MYVQLELECQGYLVLEFSWTRFNYEYCRSERAEQPPTCEPKCPRAYRRSLRHVNLNVLGHVGSRYDM